MKTTPDLEEITFFGRITASVTHELQNMLAVVKETAGLMEDLAAISKQDSGSLGKNLEKSIEVINRQIARGSDLLMNLNRFSHNPDNPLIQTDLYETVGEIVVLSARFAAMKKVSLDLHPAEQPISLTINVVRLQMALFSCIELCLDIASSGETLHINLEEEPERVKIQFSWAPKPCVCGGLEYDLTETDSWLNLTQILVSLNGSIEFDPKDNTVFLYLTPN
jgi:C4-dicarboxylate-specific signal transduction histidine kinase